MGCGCIGPTQAQSGLQLFSRVPELHTLHLTGGSTLESRPNLTAPQQIIYERMQKVFKQHRHKFDKHRAKGSAFAQALDDLEAKLFGGPQE